MKVKAIRRVVLDTPVPVYDLTVPVTENFKLNHGPYVHNSKDVSDALAAVVYGLITRREIWALHGVSLMKVPESIKTSMKSKESNSSTK